ncbi:cobalt-precorrin 6A reductase [Desulfosporosinus acidiphilus SJ4]|uniref:Cobalt-precorrin 6A reductase n=1 Tax=Desulfosporosinus acidiphilus (strain DSM 22704 / JCM 16185 / SJ4) TaxID=646529 RepID=I4D6G5_DESAJ|nr:precorrin-6A reductase [Desulfosporosinus acidiphilus]AFM41389.1 cobalt-precorrin 6A reductase [Desulfosporosinus acidiphilus SJ4]
MKFLVLAGTEDGRNLAEAIKSRGHEVLVSTLTAYGADLVAESGLDARSGAINAEQLTDLLKGGSYSALVDATHPYALQVKEIAQNVCSELKIPYLRWERLPLDLEDHRLIHWAEDIPGASQKAAALGERILLTTGSNSLPDWRAQPCLNNKSLFIRVLPTSQVLSRCENLGFKPNQIIAAQGPFSQAWDEAMFRQLKINVVVAKESGQVGGTLEKAEACRRLDIPLVLLKRPSAKTISSSDIPIVVAHSIPQFLKQMEELFDEN